MSKGMFCSRRDRKKRIPRTLEQEFARMTERRMALVREIIRKGELRGNHTS